MLRTHSLKNQNGISVKHIVQYYSTWKNAILRLSSVFLKLKHQDLSNFEH